MSTLSKLFTSIIDGTLFIRMKKHFNSARHLFYISDDNIRRNQINYLNYNQIKKKYSYVLEEEIPDFERKNGNKIWTCWMQGMENAPELCKLGHDRMKQLFSEKNVVVITAENYDQYVTLPDYIIDKWKKGIISNTHISDILRYYLLYEHGGTWIDSTVLIIDDNLPDYFFNSRLFVFADYISGLIPNYQSSFITAYSHSKLIGCVINLINHYWQNENYTVDYNLYHYFFQLAQEKYVEEWNEVPKYPNHATHILRKELYDRFSLNRFEQIKNMCPVQKLSHHKKISNIEEGSFYDVLINNGRDFFNIIF